MKRVVVMVSVLIGSALACGGVATPSLQGDQIAAFAEQVRGAEKLPPATAATGVVAATFSEEVGMVSPGCAEVLSEALQRRAPGTSANMLFAIFGLGEGGCPPTCVQLADDTMRSTAPWLQMDIAGKQCDAVGPDPLFTGPYAGLRGAVGVTDYAMLRALIDPVIVGARGTEHEEEIAAAMKVVAIGYALRGPYPDDAPPEKLMTTGNVDESAVRDALRAALETCTEPGHARGVFEPAGKVVAMAPGSSNCERSALEGATLPASMDGGYFVVDVWTE